ncbi:MAG TPA: hypothetical protein VKV73_28690, partial [Chloroflexota bacterium]|nr:hypothetical protein [Chloroflexota bacterium]
MLRGRVFGDVRWLVPATRLHLASAAHVQWLLRCLLIVAASLYLVGFAVAGLLRLNYAYPLDRMEEASLAVLRHVLQGQPVYGPPTLTYVPVVYTPLYFYIAAFAGLFTGASLVPLRLVSFLSSLIAAALIFGLVFRETKSRTLGLVSAALFAGSTSFSLTSLDLARAVGEWARAAGKGDQPSTGALLEISGAFATSSTPAGDQWRSELAGALQARKYDYVLWDPQSDAFLL